MKLSVVLMLMLMEMKNDNFWGVILLCLVAFFFGSFTGWMSAHHEIATECVRQGSFYLNDKDFKCALQSVEGELK